MWLTDAQIAQPSLADTKQRCEKEEQKNKENLQKKRKNIIRSESYECNENTTGQSFQVDMYVALTYRKQMQNLAYHDMIPNKNSWYDTNTQWNADMSKCLFASVQGD